MTSHRPPTVPPQPALRVPASVFEAMFVRGLKAEGRLVQELEALGYHMKQPEVDYPIALWQRTVAVARQVAYAKLGEEDAYRQLGRQFGRGFSETLIGRVAVVALPMIGPARALERLPRYLAMVGRADIEVTLSPVGDRGRRLHLTDRYNRPDMMAGSLEHMLELTSVQPRITVEERSAEGYRLLIRW